MLSINDRITHVDKLEICKNCLSRYAENKCKFKGCKKCGKFHNNLLHSQNDEAPTQSCSTAVNIAPTTNVNILNILSTVVVKIYDNYNEPILARALLDSGSQSNFISIELADKLRLPRKGVTCTIPGVNTSKSRAVHSITTKIESRLYLN